MRKREILDKLIAYARECNGAYCALKVPEALVKDDERVEAGATIRVDSAIRRELNSLTDLLIRKNADYGNAAFGVAPLAPELDARTAILVRMGDKIRRLESLARKDAAVVGESFEDTVRDLAGYCILWLAAKDCDNS